MTEEDKKHMAKKALEFYQNAEAPTANDFDWLFTALVNHDEGELEDLFERFGLRYTDE